MLLQHPHTLVQDAFRRFQNTMDRFGDTLSPNHANAVRCIIDRYASLSSGRSSGRFAFALPPGCGKTESAVAWITTMAQHGWPYSVAVCASRVAQLEDLLERLYIEGVSPESIGIAHSLMVDPDKALKGMSGYAKHPPSASLNDKPVVLVTHARASKEAAVEAFMSYRGERRSLVIWDESLLASEPVAINLSELESCLGAIHPLLRDGRLPDTLRPAVEIGEQALQAVSGCVAEHDKEGATRDVELCANNAEDRRKYVAALRSANIATGPLECLVETSSLPMRTLKTQSGHALVSYTLAVPESVDPVVILDASYRVRELERMDTSIKEDPAYRACPPIKRYDRVSLHTMRTGSGRSSIEKSIREGSDKLLHAIVETIKHDHPTAPILFVVFKQRPFKGGADGVLDFEEKVRHSLQSTGIDPDEVLGDGTPRFQFLTWGSETATNAFKACRVVFLVGLLHKPQETVAAHILGQEGCLARQMTRSEISAVMLSEVAHAVYQAINRASMRSNRDGQAPTCDVYIPFPNGKLRECLSPVLPGAQWRRWVPTAEYRNQTEHLAVEILTILDAYAGDRMSSKLLRPRLSRDVSNDVFRDAKTLVPELSRHWAVEKRSFVRAAA